MNVPRTFGLPAKPLFTRLLVLGLCVGALAGAAIASAPAATSSAAAGDPRIAALQKQVRALQAQVKALRKDNNDQWGAIGASFDSQSCLGAQIADLIQGTWGVVDQVALAQQKTYFGPQTAVPDYGTCENFVRPEVPRLGIQVPPKIDPLLPLLQWIHG
jgi:hypothetical protein